jgi:hypothetical protein
MLQKHIFRKTAIFNHKFNNAKIDLILDELGI